MGRLGVGTVRCFECQPTNLAAEGVQLLDLTGNQCVADYTVNFNRLACRGFEDAGRGLDFPENLVGGGYWQLSRYSTSTR